MYDLTLRPGPALIYGFPMHADGKLVRRTADVTDKAHRFLFQSVHIEPGVTLAGLLRLFETSPKLIDVFRLQYAEQLCAEASKGPLPDGEGSEANDPQPLEALELCWGWGLDTHTGEYSSVNTLDLNGLGPVLRADDSNERLKAGERVRWSVSLMPVRELLHLPVVVRSDFDIQESDVYAKAYGRPVGSGIVSEVTLGQVLHGLLTELCFHGSPEDKAELTAELRSQVAEIDAGTTELKDAEDVFEELGFGDARVFEAMFESPGGLSRREIRWALGQVEDTEPVGPAFEVKFGGRVVVRPEFCDLGGREFRRRLAQWRSSEVPAAPAAELRRTRSGDCPLAGAWEPANLTASVKHGSESKKLPAVPGEDRGLRGALASGMGARRDWVATRDVVLPAELAKREGCELKDIEAAAGRGDLFTLDVDGTSYVPAEFLELKAPVVVAICRALGSLTDADKFVFWKRTHGALGGRPVLECLKAEGAPGLERVLQLARAHTRERTSNEGSAMSATKSVPTYGTGADN